MKETSALLLDLKSKNMQLRKEKAELEKEKAELENRIKQTS